ncbi:murein L,D-transpeptidase catalytic domain family protein [Ferruginibacter sp.]
MKKQGLKKFHLFFSSLFIFILHIPFVFAKNRPVAVKTVGPKIVVAAPPVEEIPAAPAVVPGNTLAMVYDSLRLNVMGLSQQAFDCAMHGFDYLVKAGKIANRKIISIADFSLPSYKKRLFVIDLEKYKVVFNTYVAHGVNSGKEYAAQFSNRPESNQSSLGFYETMNTYIGKNGYSLHLQGLDKGFNDNADSRAIVMHGADYVNEDLIQSQGYIGRSWGCPAVSEQLHKPIINKIKNGTCFFIYSPDKNYLSHSKILKQAAGMATANRS